MNFQARLDIVRMKMQQGLPYQDAKILAQPIIDEMNREGEKIAKKYKRKFHKFSFVALMR